MPRRPLFLGFFSVINLWAQTSTPPIVPPPPRPVIRELPRRVERIRVGPSQENQCQPKVEIHRVVGRRSERLIDAVHRWKTAQRQTWREARSAEEKAVLAVATKKCSELFQAALQIAPPITTITEHGQDILIARWTLFDDRSRISEVILWDTPKYTSFTFQLPRGTWASDAAIRSTFERLLLPPRPDAKTPPARGVTVNIARDPYSRQWVGAGGLLIDYFPRQFATGFGNWLELWETSAASFLSAGFSKWLSGIGERFPPLESRVGRWSKQQLFDELAHPGGFWTSDRDRVLAKELLHRNLVDEELLSLLQKRRPDASETVLSVIVSEHQVTRFVSTIRTYLQTAVHRDDKANHPFQIVDRTDEANFTDIAIDILNQDYRLNSAFKYAARHGVAWADYDALAELPHLDADHQRKWYLSEMRRRLELTIGPPTSQ
jgi:hypothetical protein